MSLFCLLWTPFFYLFWRSVSGRQNLAAGVLAILAGCVAALVQFFLDFFIFPGEFGLSRWLSGCVDIVVVPVLVPFLVYLLLMGLKIVSGASGFACFALLWLIPGAVIKALSWSSQHDPILLILVPILWTAIAVGITFFIKLITESRVLVIILSLFGILMVPFAAATSYWAFFSQKSAIGFLSMLVAAAPALVSAVVEFKQSE